MTELTKAEQLANALSITKSCIVDTEAARELRRLSPMEARVKELEIALNDLMSDVGGGKKSCEHNFACICAFDNAKQALGETK